MFNQIKKRNDRVDDFDSSKIISPDNYLDFINPDFHRWEVLQTLDLVTVPIVSGETTEWQLLGIYGYSQYSLVGIDSISYDGVLAVYRF